MLTANNIIVRLYLKTMYRSDQDHYHLAHVFS